MRGTNPVRISTTWNIGYMSLSSSSEPLVPEELALALYKDSAHGLPSNLIFTDPGFNHITARGSRAPMSLILTASAASMMTGSVEKSLMTDLCPLPRMGSLGYQCPAHRFNIACFSAVSKAATSQPAKSCCLIERAQYRAATEISSVAVLGSVHESDFEAMSNLEGVGWEPVFGDFAGVNSAANPFNAPKELFSNDEICETCCQHNKFSNVHKTKRT